MRALAVATLLSIFGILFSVSAHAADPFSAPACDSSGITPPSVATMPPAQFPFVGLMIDHPSTTTLLALISEDGKVSWEMQTGSAGSRELDLAASFRLEQEIFHPGTMDGKPVACRMSIETHWSPTPKESNSLPACDASNVVPPTELSPQPFRYPALAVRLNEEGNVTVEATVDKNGRVSNELVTEPSGFDALDYAAYEQVASKLFQPATENGKPVTCNLLVHVNWKL